MKQLAQLNDTITAIATPLGVAGVGVIRISGSNALSILSSISTKLPKAPTPNHMYFTSFINPHSAKKIDDGYAVLFKAPHSFTGEDIAEIHCHSGDYILKTLLSAILLHDARPATEGEFSKRAFINGKLTLEKAESLIDLIHASNTYSHAVALNHQEGSLYKAITQQRSQLIRLLEHLEGSIDFPDEIPPIGRPEAKKTITTSLTKLQHILNNQDFGEQITNGIKTLIVGKPNTGKSSLFNQLIGKNRAIVTATKGTTRDYIEAPIELAGTTLKLMDTAGIRATQNHVELLGIEKINELIQRAHLVLWVIDGSTPLEKEDLDTLDKIRHHPNVLVVANKADLYTDLCKLPKKARQWPVIKLSTKTKVGIDALKTTIITTTISTFDSIDLDLICNIRQQTCISKLSQTLLHLSNELDRQIEDDLLATDLKKAILLCGEITGEDLTEEVLDGIFSRFCVGK